MYDLLVPNLHPRDPIQIREINGVRTLVGYCLKAFTNKIIFAFLHSFQIVIIHNQNKHTHTESILHMLYILMVDLNYMKE